MKMEKATRDQIVRNVIVSLFIYLLPIAAMFITFLINGQRPWEKKTHAIENVKQSIIKNSQNNGSND
jgi:hypothetical protein